MTLHSVYGVDPEREAFWLAWWEGRKDELAHEAELSRSGKRPQPKKGEKRITPEGKVV